MSTGRTGGEDNKRENSSSRSSDMRESDDEEDGEDDVEAETSRYLGPLAKPGECKKHAAASASLRKTRMEETRSDIRQGFIDRVAQDVARDEYHRVKKWAEKVEDVTFDAYGYSDHASYLDTLHTLSTLARAGPSVLSFVKKHSMVDFDFVSLKWTKPLLVKLHPLPPEEAKAGGGGGAMTTEIDNSELFYEAYQEEDVSSYAPSREACRECGKNTVSEKTRQARSADEPMTTFYHCKSCKAKWHS